MAITFRSLSALLCAALASGATLAQQAAYPNKPVHFILPFPPGGPTDILGRIIGQKLSAELGQPVVPENRPGAGGNVGLEYAAKQPPDGYTIVLAAPTLTNSPTLYTKLGYEPVRDFAPISLVAQIPNVLLVHPSVPAKSLKELARLAKANPGKLNFGSGGVGTSNHLGSEMFKALAGVNIVHVPYRGSNEAMVAMMGGHVDMVVIGIPPALPQIRTGKVRALAVLAAERTPALPDVPTAAEAGFAHFEVLTTYGILAPAGTPRDIIERLNAEWVKLAAQADTREKMQTAGYDTMSSTPEQYREFIKADIGRWAKVIRDAKLNIE